MWVKEILSLGHPHLVKFKTSLFLVNVEVFFSQLKNQNQNVAGELLWETEAAAKAYTKQVEPTLYNRGGRKC